ncbi:MAG: hypothetical protein GC180_04290 [Bacteroidetes bacterium]|nr:hypothetical protein [Bacteroidota bacterium]
MKSKLILAGILKRFTALLLSSAVLCSGFIQSFACSTEDYGPYYYNLIPESDNNWDPYAPYYSWGYSLFGRSDDPNATVLNNMESWQVELKSDNVEAIRSLIFESSESSLLQLISSIKDDKALPKEWENNPLAQQLKKNKKSPVLDYLSFAKKCEKHVTRESNWWENSEPSDETGMHQLLEEGERLLKKCKDKELKERYRYQILRLHFYLGEYQAVNAYYAQHFSDSKWNNKLRFQAANYDFGAAFRLAHKQDSMPPAEKASLILKLSNAFQNCEDCAITYFEDLHFFNAQDYFEAARSTELPQQKIDIWMLGSLRSIPPHVALDKILDIDPNAPEIRSIMDRMLENSQQERFLRYESTLTDYFASEEWNQICMALRKGSINKKATDRAQFSFLLAYFDYISGKFHQARKELENASLLPGSENLALQHQQRVLRSLLDLETWNSKILNNAHLLIGQLNEVLAINHPELTEYTFRRLEELASNNGQMNLERLLFASMYRDIESELSYPDILMLESSFKNQEKNVIERWVSKNQKLKMSTLMEWKGNTLLAMHRFEEAAEAYKQAGHSSMLNTDPLHIRINDCHDCDHRELPGHYTQLRFCEEMVYLNNEAEKGNALSAFQYANGLYNITWFGNSRDAISYHLQSEEETEHPSFYSMSLAYPAYERALKLTRDPEFKAKIHFMMAKCEQNEYDTDGSNVSYHSYYGEDLPCDPIKNQEFRKNFLILKKQFANTEFYKMALKECSYFEHYVRVH